MTLQIRFECPQCHQPLSLNFQDFAPGYRKVCMTCQIPARMTKSGLERFSRELRQFCQS